jgi:signal transduction histidine kinase
LLTLTFLPWIPVQYQQRLVRQTKAASQEHARLAALEERRRIARDVHDVLAHTLTILMVHVNSARVQVHDDPEGTAEILDEVAVYGRRCLADIRRTLGLLSENPLERGAKPGDAPCELGELVESYRKAGIDIDLDVDLAKAGAESLAKITTTLWSVTYRIVQESVANAAKHGAGSGIVVVIAIDDDGIRIECRNEVATKKVLELPSGGNGIDGMRERALSVGGTFRAGLDDATWVVRADLPIRASDTARRPARLGRAS